MIADRVRHWFDWRTFTVVAGILVLLLVGYVIFTGAQSTHDANVAANQRGKAASRRIDLLSKELAREQAALQAAAEDRGSLRADIDALSAQVRQLGGKPVATVHATPRTTPRATAPTTPATAPTASAAPRPHVTPTTHPRPTPSPTCVRLAGICLPGVS